MSTPEKQTNPPLQNDFKPFAVANDANVVSQADYETLAALGEGFRKGLAKSAELNKTLRQSSSMAAAVARFTADKTGEAVLDNGDIDALCGQLERAVSSVSSLRVAEATGTADALTALFVPTVKTLENGLLVHVRAGERNETVAPTFEANGTGAKVIVKGNNVPLLAGDIAGAGHWLELQYDEKLDKWVLQNPAKGVALPSGVPVGTVEYFAVATPPAGYLKADGSAVGRETYPDLFSAIGTTFGEGDGTTTFNLPDLMGRFAEGSTLPGTVKEAGLPNITGTLGSNYTNSKVQIFGESIQEYIDASGALSGEYVKRIAIVDGTTLLDCLSRINFDASGSNPIYGASDTVQPPALTLLPCIKAFDAATNPGLIDVTELANEVAGKLDKTVGDTSVKYVTDTFDDGSSWYRKWSDGWIEQGGHFVSTTGVNGLNVITLNVPCHISAFECRIVDDGADTTASAGSYNQTTSTHVRFRQGWASACPISWQACGREVAV